MRILVPALLLVFAVGAFAVDHLQVGSGKADGRQFTFALSRAEIQSTPQWRSDLAPRAVAPRRAIQTARKQLKSFVADGDRWRFDGISLFDLGDDRWIFVVRFGRQYPPTTAVYGGEYFDIPVLMDGTVVKPTVIFDERLKMREDSH